MGQVRTEVTQGQDEMKQGRAETGEGQDKMQ